MSSSDQSAGRGDGRADDRIRAVTITPNFIDNAEGSVLIAMGRTKVICTASIEEDVPRWMRGRGKGWVTAEYGMLPRSTNTRMDREAARGKVGGRTMEIQRLIGRSIRACVDMEALGERTVKLDCDVIQADGGTRTASITGAWVALALALKQAGVIDAAATGFELGPIHRGIAAISVGIVGGRPLLDLCYEEDSSADVDMNVVMTSGGEFVELQGTAEGQTFSRKDLDALADLAWIGIKDLLEAQSAALAAAAASS